MTRKYGIWYKLEEAEKLIEEDTIFLGGWGLLLQEVVYKAFEILFSFTIPGKRLEWSQNVLQFVIFDGHLKTLTSVIKYSYIVILENKETVLSNSQISEQLL